VTIFTLAYAWTGGMRASLLTDRLQMIAAFILLGVLMAVLLPPMASKGLPGVPISTHQAGLTFCLLALVQVLSYPFHDPVLTDRGFLNSPRWRASCWRAS
jgi:Na+/proline symporter